MNGATSKSDRCPTCGGSLSVKFFSGLACGDRPCTCRKPAGINITAPTTKVVDDGMNTAWSATANSITTGKW